MKDWWKKVYADNTELWAAVLMVLGVLEKAGLPGQRQDLNDNETIAGYVEDCVDRNLDAEKVWAARKWIRNGSKYFPTSPEFASLAREFVRENWVQLTEKVLVNGDERLSLRFVDPGSDEWARHVGSLEARTLALEDLSDTERETARRRLEKALEKVEEKNLRPVRQARQKIDDSSADTSERDRHIERVR